MHAGSRAPTSLRHASAAAAGVNLLSFGGNLVRLRFSPAFGCDDWRATLDDATTPHLNR